MPRVSHKQFPNAPGPPDEIQPHAPHPKWSSGSAACVANKKDAVMQCAVAGKQAKSVTGPAAGEGEGRSS